MTRLRADVAVLGAGPAGLQAALAAAEAGACVHVIDANSAGGRYGEEEAAGPAAVAQARRAGVRFHFQAEIWAIFPEHRVCATQAGEPLEIHATCLVLATGAHDRVAPFPGWTLPGVVTCGEARLARAGGPAAGRRVALAGSGLFLLAAARAVRAAGGSVAAYVEAQTIGPRLVAHLAGAPERWFETLGSLRALRAGRPIRRFGWLVTEALGGERVEAVRIARVAPSRAPGSASPQTITGIDALVIGWGLLPSLELSALLRCRHAYDELRGGWYCVADAETGRTSVATVYAAGDVTGVAGVRAARLSGRLAGAAAAAQLGFTATRGRHAPTLRRLRRARASAAGLNRIFAAPGALAKIARDDTVLCRCEGVTYAAVRAAIAGGAATVPGVKRSTRAGMGPCQGRLCGWAVARETAADDPAKAGFNQPRIPVRPVSLAVVAQTVDERS